MFDIEVAVIPAGLDAMEPGPVLAAIVASIEVGALSGYDRVVVLRAHQRLASHYAAQVYADMAAVADSMGEEDDDPVVAGESAAAEIRAALRLTRRAADAELGFALDLKQRLPGVFAALSGGEIDVRRAKTIVYGTAHLSAETAREVVERVIGDAPRLTTGQLAARLRKLCIEADPAEAQQRYEEAVADRRVVAEPTDSGTANLLGLDLPPHQVAVVTRRINHLARSLKSQGESRTMDQLRADVYLDLLTGTSSEQATGSGVVDIHVDLDTLAGLADHPGELAGYGPVIADIARQVAADQPGAQWRYTITDPHSGQPLHQGITRRRPTNPQRREVEMRNPTCVFPGCRMPATDCDLDHRIPWAQGGETTPNQLVPLCRHDHRLKHLAQWTHQALPGGDHQWTSQLGHTYTTSGLPPDPVKVAGD